MQKRHYSELDKWLVCGKKSKKYEIYTKFVHKLFSSPSIILMIRSRRMRWAGHVARMGDKRNV
jgi:hypothetical protein